LGLWKMVMSAMSGNLPHHQFLASEWEATLLRQSFCLPGGPAKMSTN
jgi:hypothetical protein